MDASVVPTSLYLHGGPGFSSSGERAWFGDALPIDWWDQPSEATHGERAYRHLVESAQEHLCILHQRAGVPICVVAHSFGASLAYELARHCSDCISNVTLLTPVFDPIADFRHLASRLDNSGAAPSTVIRQIDALGPYPAREAVLSLALTLGQVPNLFQHYWSPASADAQRRYNALLPNGPSIDSETFVNVIWSELHDRLKNPIESWDGDVLVILGQDDLLRRPESTDEITSRFPSAVIRWEPCGHQPVFELPHPVWSTRLNPQLKPTL